MDVSPKRLNAWDGVADPYCFSAPLPQPFRLVRNVFESFIWGPVSDHIDQKMQAQKRDKDNEQNLPQVLFSAEVLQKLSIIGNSLCACMGVAGKLVIGTRNGHLMLVDVAPRTGQSRIVDEMLPFPNSEGSETAARAVTCVSVAHRCRYPLSAGRWYEWQDPAVVAIEKPPQMVLAGNENDDRVHVYAIWNDTYIYSLKHMRVALTLPEPSDGENGVLVGPKTLHCGGEASHGWAVVQPHSSLRTLLIYDVPLVDPRSLPAWQKGDGNATDDSTPTLGEEGETAALSSPHKKQDGYVFMSTIGESMKPPPTEEIKCIEPSTVLNFASDITFVEVCGAQMLVVVSHVVYRFQLSTIPSKASESDSCGRYPLLSPVTCIASSEGTEFAVGCENGDVCLWRGWLPAAATACTGHFERVCSVAFCDQGKKLVSAGQDKRVHVYDLLESGLLVGRCVFAPDSPSQCVPSFVGASFDSQVVAVATADLGAYRVIDGTSGNKVGHFAIDGSRTATWAGLSPEAILIISRQADEEGEADNALWILPHLKYLAAFCETTDAGLALSKMVQGIEPDQPGDAAAAATNAGVASKSKRGSKAGLSPSGPVKLTLGALQQQQRELKQAAEARRGLPDDPLSGAVSPASKASKLTRQSQSHVTGAALSPQAPQTVQGTTTSQRLLMLPPNAQGGAASGAAGVGVAPPSVKPSPSAAAIRAPPAGTVATSAVGASLKVTSMVGPNPLGLGCQAGTWEKRLLEGVRLGITDKVLRAKRTAKRMARLVQDAEAQAALEKQLATRRDH